MVIVDLLEENNCRYLWWRSPSWRRCFFWKRIQQKLISSAAYASRYLAKNVVASKIADKCLIQLAYAIGVSKPLSIYVDLFDNDEEKNKHVEKLINENFDLSPRGIREMLGLNKANL